MKITVNNVYKDFQFKSKKIEGLCKEILIDHQYNMIKLNFIFSNDLKLNSLKIEYFNEDVLTDVITFPIKNDNDLEAEIYISVDRAIFNSKENDVTLNSEIMRLIIHALLHLLGYDDEKKKDKDQMFKIQEELVDKFSNINLL
jgi:rRNA maturation RNase YbeY|tara:strand:- start:722 stop:1150 length:429 start_codon:yes stop_codon:yes gene_type:complete